MRPGRELPGRFRRWRWASPFTGEQRTRWGSARAAVRRQEVTVEGVATGTRDRAVRRGRGHGHGQTGLAGSVGGFCFSLNLDHDEHACVAAVLQELALSSWGVERSRIG